MYKEKLKSAFTLVEIICCIVILGILSAVAIGSLSKKPDLKEAAISIANDLEYASAYFYNKPYFNLYSGSLFASNEFVFYGARIRQIDKKYVKNGAIECKDRGACLSYTIGKFNPLMPNLLPPEKDYLRDHIEPGKLMYFPIGSGASKKRNAPRYAKMPRRLNLHDTFGVNIAAFVMFPNESKPIIIKTGQSGKRPAKFYFDPLTGAFLIGPKGYLNSPYSKSKIDDLYLVAKYIVDITQNQASRIVIQVRDASIKEAEEINRFNTYCIAINGRNHNVEWLPKDENKRQVAFYHLGKKKSSAIYCDELLWKKPKKK